MRSAAQIKGKKICLKCELNWNNIITCIAHIHNNGLVWLFQAFDVISHVIISKIKFSSNILWSLIGCSFRFIRFSPISGSCGLFLLFVFFISREIFDYNCRRLNYGSVYLYWSYFLKTTIWNVTTLKWNLSLTSQKHFIRLEILTLREKDQNNHI